MAKQQTVINLDPIDRKKKTGIVARLLITRWYGGRKAETTEPYGHYMFCGEQRKGKTSSVLWYTERLIKKYSKRRIKYYSPEKGRMIKFKETPELQLYSNFGVGKPFIKTQLADLIDRFDPYKNEVRIILVDEIHTYFPKEGVDKDTKRMINELNGIFSQLGKRNVYLLSTAQVYGRLDKALREQCLYMINCRISRSGVLINEVIPQSDILVDDLGRWAGNPKYIWRHGMSRLEYDTKKIIRQ